MPNALSSLLGQSDIDYARSLQNARRRAIPSALREPEQGLQGGFHLGEVGGMPINLTDIVPADLGVNSLAKLMAAGSAKFAVPMLSALGATGIGSIASKGAKFNALASALPGQRGATAYHGSPHTFDKFSLDKIGTGEGAQAYGHGLYFAENEDTARAYRNELSPSARLTVGNTVIPTGHKTPSQLSGDVQGLAAEAVNRFKGDVQTAIDWLKGWGSPSHSKAAQLLGRNLKAGRVSYEPDAQGGSMYQVRINADPADFLDWDKPLAEQSDKVRAGIGTIVDRDLNTETGWAKMTGQEALRAAAERDGRVGRGAGEELLHAQGIPGIKYLDAGSRGAGDGSRNFVVFNDKLIDILKRYGWVPGTAIPAGLMANAQLLTGEGIPRETQY